MSTEAAPEAPASHPDPDRWWRVIQRQSWLCYVALIAEVPLLLWLGISEHGSLPLAILNLGLVAGAATYAGGSTVIDAIKAWRST